MCEKDRNAPANDAQAIGGNKKINGMENCYDRGQRTNTTSAQEWKKVPRVRVTAAEA